MFENMKQSARISLAGFIILTLVLITAAFAAGCGSEAEADNNPAESAPTKTVEPPKKWPDVEVTAQSLKTLTAKTFGTTVAPEIALVRTTSAEEISPGRYKVTIKFNQPGACHASSATWRGSDFQQTAFRLLGELYKHPAVDLVELETYATESSSIQDPEQFEKIFRVVVERSRAEGTAWDAMKGHTVLPDIATELWVTPKAQL